MQSWQGLARTDYLCSMLHNSAGIEDPLLRLIQTPETWYWPLPGSSAAAVSLVFSPYEPLHGLVELPWVWWLDDQSKPLRKPDGRCTNFYDQLSNVTHHFCNSHSPLQIQEEGTFHHLLMGGMSKSHRRAYGVGRIFSCVVVYGKYNLQ